MMKHTEDKHVFIVHYRSQHQHFEGINCGAYTSREAAEQFLHNEGYIRVARIVSRYIYRRKGLGVLYEAEIIRIPIIK